MRISRTDGFEFGVKLTRSGFIYEERSAEGDLVIKCSRYTIDIPLNYKYYWGATQKWYWSLGLTPSIYVAGNGMWSDQYTPNLSLNPDSVYSRFNLGASMGIGYGIINVFFESNMTNTWSKELINLIDGMTGYKTTAHRYIGAGIAINLKF